MSYTFTDLIVDTIREVKEPLSQREIWDKATELGFAEKLGSRGKTPWATVGARIYTDINDNPESIYVQVGKRPAKFYLKELAWHEEKSVEMEEVKEKKKEKISFNERDLHPLLVKFIYSNQHFKCHGKTIFHENSTKKQKGYNQWLHPDIVGIYFPFNDYSGETQKLQEAFKISSFKLYSYELKVSLNFSNLRECYFQAVSNSSWANEGYLVALDIEDDPTFRDELRRLNNSFGIGIIQLNPEGIEESEILLPSKETEFIDWDTVNRLVDENKDFKQFICDLTEDIKVGKVKSSYDSIMKEEEYQEYVFKKNIKKNK